jgi:hypothetical protein
MILIEIKSIKSSLRINEENNQVKELTSEEKEF